MESKTMKRSNEVKQDFFEILSQMQPDLAYDLSQKVQEINRAISEFGGEGKLTLECSFKQSPKFSEAARIISFRVNATMPKKSYKDSVRFATYNGEIVSDDPDQMNLPFENEN